LISFLLFPAQVRLSESQTRELHPGLPFVTARAGENRVLSIEPAKVGTNAFYGAPVSLRALAEGKVTVEFKLFGRIPVRKITVEVVPRLMLSLGGHSIGVLLQADGVIVTRTSLVQDDAGNSWSPARTAGVLPGDVITKVDGQSIHSEEALAQALDEAGRQGRHAVLDIKRGKAVFTRPVKPVLCRETKRYRIGLYVRDGAAGVGTLTFFDNETHRFAALGHIITDGETGTPVSVYNGRIVRAQVTGIEEGKKGKPGEKLGVFVQESDVIGSIDANTEFGIGGTLYDELKNPAYDQPLPMALASEVVEGPASMVTVVEGQRLEMFDVIIQKVSYQSRPQSKGMVIKIVDQRLLSRTGGIIQGMSGSPIVQGGKVVGAITHVLVNDPTRGFGVFAEWMVETTGIWPRSSKSAGRAIGAQRLVLTNCGEKFSG
jgi:stage IV sporulation protein B